MQTSLLKLLIILLVILILASCATKPAVVVPQVEKYCPRPVRPFIEERPVWTMQELLQLNLTVIDYTLKLEASLECWESKPAKNK